MIGYKTRKCLIIFANGNFSFYNSRMEKILTDSETGQQFMLHPGPQEYSNNPELIDWDANVDEWKEDVMGQWPFGNPSSENHRVTQEALDCLGYLDSYLEYEEWVMEQIEAQDDDDIESEEEGYNSDDEGVDENDIDDWVFGLAPMLMNIHL